jgi:predicted enzyme related to lactoylglutathione lyase
LLAPVQIGLPGFSALYRYPKFSFLVDSMTEGMVHVQVTASRNSLAHKIVLRRVGIFFAQIVSLDCVDIELDQRRKRMADTNKATIAVPEMKLENVPVPVSDVDRAKAFYEQVGFRLDVDTRPTDTMRVVHFTPPGSACSIVFGTGMGEITEMTPGSVKGLHLVVDDLDTARSALLQRGVAVGEITEVSGVKYAGFSDPDGNLWLLQEFPPELRQPGQSFYKEENQ